MALTYDQRLKTFTAWPHRTPSASDMAAAGFIFIGKTNIHDGQADAVKCLDCKSLLEPWWDHYVPCTEHAKYKPDCPFVIAQQQAAALKTSKETSTQPSDSASRNTCHQCFDVLTQPHLLAKLQTQAKRDAEEIHKLKAEVQTLVKERGSAQRGLVLAQYGRQEDLDIWTAKVKNAKADAAVALASKETLEAAHATEIHDLKIEVKALKYMAAPSQTAKGTFEAVHTTEVSELKTEIKALTASVTPLHAAIEGLAASITRLQVDKVTVDHEAVSDINGNDHHGGAIENTPIKASIDDDYLFSGEASPSPSDRLDTEDVREEALRDACEDIFDSGREGEAEVDNAGVHAHNQTESSASNADADAGDALGTILNEDHSNNSAGAGATDDSMSDNNPASDDSWFDLESFSPSSDGPASVDSA